MWQALVEHQDESEAFLTIFFGELRFEQQAREAHLPVSAKTLEVDGQVSPLAHPWALMWKEDMQLLLGFPVAKKFAAVWN